MSARIVGLALGIVASALALLDDLGASATAAALHLYLVDSPMTTAPTRLLASLQGTVVPTSFLVSVVLLRHHPGLPASARHYFGLTLAVMVVALAISGLGFVVALTPGALVSPFGLGALLLRTVGPSMFALGSAHGAGSSSLAGRTVVALLVAGELLAWQKEWFQPRYWLVAEAGAAGLRVAAFALLLAVLAKWLVTTARAR